MDFCAIHNEDKYQGLKKASGIKSDLIFTSRVDSFIKKHNRYPNLDEIKGSDSSDFFKENVDLVKFGDDEFTKVQKILDYTKASSIEEALPILNNSLHSDLITDMYQFNDYVIVEQRNRPNNLTIPDAIDEDFDFSNDLNKNSHIIANMLYKIAKLHGIKFNYLTNQEIIDKGINLKVNGALTSNGFIYNNEIYINIDNAKIDAPLHELSHILLGSMRFLAPDIYQNLLGLIAQHPNIAKMSMAYTGRTQNDVLEEILITEFSKYLTDQPSLLDEIDDNLIYEIQYSFKRMLDTMLDGQISVKTLSEDITQFSIMELGQLVRSKEFKGSNFSSIDYAYIHRVVNNAKSELLKEGNLQEVCE